MQAQQPPANTSFFGASQPAQPPGTTAGGLFGNSQQAQQPAQAGTGFFGATQTSAPTGGLFGSSAQPSNTGNLATNTQPATGGLFGAQPKPFGTSTLPFNAQPVAHASPLMQSNFYQRERFNELPEPQQKVLEEMEKFITGQVQIKNELHARDQSTDMRHLMAGIQDFRSMQEALSASLEADTMRVQSIATSVGKDRDDNVHLYQIATNAKDRLSDGASFVDWLRQFYEGAADDFVVRIQRYRVTMEQIERHLLSLEQREQFAPQGMSYVCI
ncbi:hypothetical protein MVES_000678 [Malassezia vespertilionis]|uniref:Nucleoporin Nup54 alpha-helical domain-containing protein n=2 Tax=Malassezia vespertilionis TaxID=2020962 RepID=A0A2N1JGI0_9BASI|nr:hypothetical protein MVES_000678 [Malassezia vespertilionis]